MFTFSNSFDHTTGPGRPRVLHLINSFDAGGTERQAVELLKLRDLSLKEASALTGMSVGALKIATHRAIASLRRALQGADDE